MHFIPLTNLVSKTDVIYQYKRILNDEKIESFLQNLYRYDWDTIKTHQDTNEAYNNFILTFSTIDDTFFSYEEKKIKNKDLESPWITKEIKETTFIFNFFFKKKEKTKKEYQAYKKPVQSVKQQSRGLYFFKLTLKYKNNVKIPWQVIKEAIRKKKYKQQNLPKKIPVDKNSITETKSAAQNLIEYIKKATTWYFTYNSCKVIVFLIRLYVDLQFFFYSFFWKTSFLSLDIKITLLCNVVLNLNQNSPFINRKLFIKVLLCKDILS